MEGRSAAERGREFARSDGEGRGSAAGGAAPHHRSGTRLLLTTPYHHHYHHYPHHHSKVATRPSSAAASSRPAARRRRARCCRASGSSRASACSTSAAASAVRAPRVLVPFCCCFCRFRAGGWAVAAATRQNHQHRIQPNRIHIEPHSNRHRTSKKFKLQTQAATSS